MYSSNDEKGACELRTQIKIEQKENNIDNLKLFLKSIGRQRFSEEFQSNIHFIIKADIYNAIGNHERAYQSLVNYYPELVKYNL